RDRTVTGVQTCALPIYFSELVDAVDEQIDLARHSGGRLQVSHLQAVGASNWHLQSVAIGKMEEAHAEGIDVEFDCYPYVAGSSEIGRASCRERVYIGEA